MSELPQGWAQADLPLVCDKITDGTHHSPVNLPSGEFKYVTAKNIRPWGLDLADISYVDTKTHHEIYARCPVEKGDVLYIKDGATTGLAIVNPLDEPFSMLSSVALLKPNKAALESSYLKYWLNSPDTLSMMLERMTGTAIRRLTLTTISAQKIPIAPIPEQRRIVAKVDGLTARTARARKELDRIPTLIARYKQRLLALAFSGELTAGWRAARDIQESMETKLVGELITDVVGGKNLRCVERPPEPDERGVVKVSAVTWGEFDPLASKTLPTSFEPPEKTRIKKGDFLISRANTLELVAAVAIVKEAPGNLYLSDKVLRLELPEEDKPWLLWFMRSPAGRSAIESRATGNQLSMRNLSQSGLRSIEMPWPSPSERAEIVRRIESAFGWLDRMAADHAAAARLLPKLDAAILAKAFRGELVPQDPNDEPAAMMLERIKAVRTADVAKPKPGRGRPRQGGNVLLASTDVVSLPVAYANSSRPKGKQGMTKSRQDEDVKDKPYLASLLKSGRFSDAQSLFRAADLPVADFYKQLAWEIDNGHILDNAQELKAA